MTILKEHNNVTFTIRCINETNDSKYKNILLNRIMYIYRIFLIVKSSLKEVILGELYKLQENIFYITNIKNTVQRERSSFLSIITIVMSKSRIDVKILEERTMVVILKSRNVISISLRTSIDVFYVFIDKIENIKKESTLRENVFKKLKYF